MTRLFIPPEDWKADEIPLPEAEAKHAVQVLRQAQGDRVLLFDGTGRHADAEIVSIGKRGASVRILKEQKAVRPPPGLHLIMALIKGDRFEWVVQKATELGAASIRPVAAARSVVRIDPKDVARKVARWRQTSIEAAKQCGHLVLPEIHPPVAAGTAFREAPAGTRGIPALRPAGMPLQRLLGGVPDEVTFAIGPEGDWTPQEMAAAEEEGFIPVDLGSHVLRSETAALYVLSATTHQILGGAGGLKGTQ